MDLLTQAANLYKRCSFPTHKGLKIFGVRGCKFVNGQCVVVEERVDYFDDTLVLFDPDNNYIDHVPCTAGQPGWYWIQKSPGAAFVRYGLAVYQRGLHKGTYKALRQVQDETGVVPVIRDINQDGYADIDSHSVDQFDYPLDTGINIHACTGTPANVGIWSAGCSVVQGDWQGERWQTVFNAVYRKYDYQTRFPYAIVNAKWLSEDSTKRLMFGSMGASVTKLQQFLNEKGYGVEVTGRFLEETDRAYRSWQRKNGTPGDGICVNPPW